MADFFITFREALEAGLVIGIVVSYLFRTKQLQYLRFVWWGAATGIVPSLVAGAALFWFSSGLEGRAEQLFEGITMLIAAGLLVTMMSWMQRQRGHAQKIERQVEQHIERKFLVGILALVFFSVLREGIETAIFLLAAAKLAQGSSVVSALLGVVGACIVILMFFMASKKISLKTFFRVSTIILALFAAGLIAHGVHELQEAGLLPFLSQQAYDVSRLLPEAGVLGALMKSLFGYNANPTMLEAGVYLLGLGGLWVFLRAPKQVAQVTAVR